MSGKSIEIRDPIHGFISLTDWEREIVAHPAFQRLRRIKQLSWTDMVYPGAVHTRFEHSLGVMHVASRMFDRVTGTRAEFLRSELDYDEAGLNRDRMLVRLSTLLHDVGHPPFSHAGEDLMPLKAGSDDRYSHEDYSAAIVKTLMRDVIEQHPTNQNYHFKAEDIANFIAHSPVIGRAILWTDLVSGQMDADRADYLLRDSHHIGVAYGRYDLDRIISTLTVGRHPETDAPTLAVERGGLHAAEGLILARYMMFTQVYFQHTRRIYDYHGAAAVKSLLLNKQLNRPLKRTGCVEGLFAPPTSKENLLKYLDWTDWKALGLIGGGLAGEHGKILVNRNHYRRVHETRETPSTDEVNLAEGIRVFLGDKVGHVDQAEKSWYKTGKSDILILQADSAGESLVPLSSMSTVVHGLKPVNQVRIYSPNEKKAEARRLVDRFLREKGVS